MTPKIRLIYYVGLTKKAAVPIRDIGALLELRKYTSKLKWQIIKQNPSRLLKEIVKDL